MNDALKFRWPEAYDHVITDPPYSSHTHSTGATMKGGRAGKNDLGFSSISPELLEKIAEMIAGARSWSVIFCDDRSICTWIDAVESRGGKFIRSIPWIRWSMPQLSGDRPPQGWECVLVFWGKTPGKKSWNGPGNLTHFCDKCMRGKGKHKTQKPLSLMLKIVEYFTNYGSIILDPCAGRGTTVVAAKMLGRAACWTEIDNEELVLANARISDPSEGDKKDHVFHIEHMRRVSADKARMKELTKKIREKNENKRS